MTNFEEDLLSVLREIRDAISETSDHLDSIKTQVSTNRDEQMDAVTAGMRLFDRQTTGLETALRRIETAMSR